MAKSNISTRHWVLIAAGVLFIGYVLFQARFLILGPQVKVLSPQDGAVVYSPVVVMSGTAKNVSWLSLNDRQIFTDEKGVWEEKLLVSEGLSIIELNARDRFGRQTEKTVRIIYTN
jgi:hypothetical protein